MKLIKSPLNYTGGKFVLLPNLLELFPKNINTFIDLFMGGGNITINIEANKIIGNDQLYHLSDLFNLFKSKTSLVIHNEILSIIKKYELTLHNEEGYKQLRIDYNKTPTPIVFYVLLCYSFNHQIRFNRKHEFNISFGRDRSKYSSNMASNLKLFCDRIQNLNIEFTSEDFMDVDLKLLNHTDFVYCDPPYILSTATYTGNEDKGFKTWTLESELKLYTLLDGLDVQGVKWGLSNVFSHKGIEHTTLQNWSQAYTVHYLDKQYNNCNYHLKDRTIKTIEVFITNY